MIHLKSKLGFVPVGLAMFSMFFGSGNVVFPVLVGEIAQSQTWIAVLGLQLTAVLLPFLGLITMALFNGDYIKFFERMGKIPGWFLILCIMGIIGPFAAIPRCIVIAHGTVSTFYNQITLSVFSIISCLIIYFCCIKRNYVLDILGKYLTPFLVLSLLTIIVVGLSNDISLTPSELTSMDAFTFGLLEGYNTMDLFGAFIFSGMVLVGIDEAFSKQVKNVDEKNLRKEKVKFYLKSSLVGIILLGGIYTGMCFVSAFHSGVLTDVPREKILSTLTMAILGPYSGIVVSTAVCLACLTTAISLCVVFSEFISKNLLKDKVSYNLTLIGTLIFSFFFSTLEFSGIQRLLVPILQVSLPALIILTLGNFAHKMYNFRHVKVPVAAVFVVSLIYYLNK